jgi:hypothetical protein
MSRLKVEGETTTVRLSRLKRSATIKIFSLVFIVFCFVVCGVCSSSFFFSISFSSSSILSTTNQILFSSIFHSLSLLFFLSCYID